MSGVEESKGGDAASAAIQAWGGEPVSAEESVVLGPKNEMGYPPILFEDDIDAFMKKCPIGFDKVIAQLTQMQNKYRVLESNILPKMSALKQKMPELERTLQMIEFLRKKQEADESFKTHFNLQDNVYAKAEVEPSNSVFLWLGANTMLEYTYDEATSLLTKNLADSKVEWDDLQKRLDFIRAQMTTAEVSTRRMYNWDVVRRRKEREAAAAAAK